MDVLPTVLLALPTIFLGAFLAVLLESARERIRTRRWVMRNLRTFVERATRGPEPPTAAAIRAWLAATAADDLDEKSWRQAWYLTVSNAPDLTPLLRGEAATSVPVEVLKAAMAAQDQRGWRLRLRRTGRPGRPAQLEVR